MPGRVSLRAAAAHVAAVDPSMAEVVERVGPCRLPRRRDPDGYFAALARAILYQQLAGRAAAAIHARFVALHGGVPTPAAVLATPQEALRAAGLSAAKAAAVRDLAAKVTEGALPLERLARLGDEEVIAALRAVRGVGRWTAEMFLVFELGRPDVWPVDDYGVRRGWAIAHGRAGDLPTPRELVAEGERYRPYRSVAAWYCWAAADARPPAAAAAGARTEVSPPAEGW